MLMARSQRSPLQTKKNEPQWIPKGVLTASTCFKCKNKIDHIFRIEKVLILCIEPCK